MELLVIYLGCLIYGVLYLIGVFALAVITHHTVAALLAIAAAGACYAGFYVQVVRAPRNLCWAVTIFSIAVGAAAGLCLL